MNTKKQKSLYILYEWSLTDKEEKMILNSEIGKNIKINTPLVPLVLEDDKAIILPAYTSKELIPKDFLNKYAICKKNAEEIESELLAIEKILNQKPKLYIDLIC